MDKVREIDDFPCRDEIYLVRLDKNLPSKCLSIMHVNFRSGCNDHTSFDISDIHILQRQ
jgi:hypothetical protein